MKRARLLAVLALTVLWLGAAQPTLAQENTRYAAIVVDAETGEVLMFAYMNQEALARSIETGEAVYWSRSR